MHKKIIEAHRSYHEEISKLKKEKIEDKSIDADECEARIYKGFIKKVREFLQKKLISLIVIKGTINEDLHYYSNDNTFFLITPLGIHTEQKIYKEADVELRGRNIVIWHDKPDDFRWANIIKLDEVYTTLKENLKMEKEILGHNTGLLTPMLCLREEDMCFRPMEQGEAKGEFKVFFDNEEFHVELSEFYKNARRPPLLLSRTGTPLEQPSIQTVSNYRITSITNLQRPFIDINVGEKYFFCQKQIFLDYIKSTIQSKNEL